MKKMSVLGAVLLLVPISYATQNPQFGLAITDTQTNSKTNKTPTKTPPPINNQKTHNTEKPPTTSQENQDIPANPHDPANGTLLEGITPNDSELSRANTELLAKNAELKREIENLNTQVNILVQEQGSQLFVYGGITALISLVIGFMLAKTTNRQRW